MRRLVLLLALLVVLAGCGSSQQESAPPTTTAAAPAPPGPGDTLYAGGPWAVVLDGTNAKVYHLIGDVWQRDTSKAVTVRVLGPHGTSARVAQMAAEISAHEPLVESGIWVDGVEVPVKGGGSPTKGTIYGALGKPLAKGKHVAVAYGRTARNGSAVAWTFRVA